MSWGAVSRAPRAVKWLKPLQEKVLAAWMRTTAVSWKEERINGWMGG